MENKAYVPTEEELKKTGLIKDESYQMGRVYVKGPIRATGTITLPEWKDGPFNIFFDGIQIFPKSRSDLEAIIRSLTP